MVERSPPERKVGSSNPILSKDTKIGSRYTQLSAQLENDTDKPVRSLSSGRMLRTRQGR